MRKRKKKISLIRRIIILITLILIIMFLKNLFFSISNKDRYEKTQILYNNEFINLVNDVIVEDSILYISEEDIKNIFDETIYYNVGDKELITTYNKHVAVLQLDKNQMLINDTDIDMQGKLTDKNSKIYLPIKDLEIVYDIETNYAENSNVLIIDSITKAKKQAIALKNTKLKLKKSIFSVTMEKIHRTDYLYIIEENKNNCKVRSQSGNIGYVKKSKLSNIETIREDYKEEQADIEVLKISDLNEEIKNNSQKESVFIIEDFCLEKNKIVSKFDINSEEYKDYYNKVSEKNIGMIGEFANNSSVSENFSTYQKRNTYIKELYNQVIQKQYNGTCISFENIDDINSFYRFLIELTPLFKESGLKVIVKYNNKMDKSKLNKIVDFVI